MNNTTNDTKDLVRHTLDEVEELKEIGQAIEEADFIEELASTLLSDMGKFNMACYLLRTCGRSDLAEMVEKAAK